MTQPTFVPIAEADQVRPARHLHVPGAVDDLAPGRAGRCPPCAGAPASGRRGPTRASRSAWPTASRTTCELGEGESAHDVLLGVALIAAKRAALFGRAPCIYDVRFALNLWGFLDDAPAALQAPRRAAFSSISHDYVAQRALVDAVSEETLGLSPDDVRSVAAVA